MTLKIIFIILVIYVLYIVFNSDDIDNYKDGL
jgi:hypothetical protein